LRWISTRRVSTDRPVPSRETFASRHWPYKTPSQRQRVSQIRHVRLDYPETGNPRHRALPGWRKQAARVRGAAQVELEREPVRPPALGRQRHGGGGDDGAPLSLDGPQGPARGPVRNQRARPRADHLRGRFGRDHHLPLPGLCRGGGRGALSRARVRDVPNLGACGGGHAGHRARKGPYRRSAGDPRRGHGPHPADLHREPGQSHGHDAAPFGLRGPCRAAAGAVPACAGRGLCGVRRGLRRRRAAGGGRATTW
jgi:hypothetical protein